MSLHLKRHRFLPTGLQRDYFSDSGTGFWGRLFTTLYQKWGDPYWWPGVDAWEVAVGAILTQNTAWSNVEKALEELRTRGWNNATIIRETNLEELAQAIRSAGYFNQKARKLVTLADWWCKAVENGRYNLLSDLELREELLELWGVGPETADAIACYALGRPLFVVDAYTVRMMKRLRGDDTSTGYAEIQREVHEELPTDTMLLNHLHGLIVVLGKEHCTARQPRCDSCPLVDQCTFGQTLQRPCEAGDRTK